MKAMDYIQEFGCRFLGIHDFGKWENESKFMDYGGWAFGWVGRWGRKCAYCGEWQYRRPFLRRERERLIKEKNVRPLTH